MKYLIILCLPLLAISGCSDKDEIPTPKTPAATTSTQQAEPAKISPSNPFSTQLNALETAKQVSGAAQQSIDDNQQKLEQASDYSQP